MTFVLCHNSGRKLPLWSVEVKTQLSEQEMQKIHHLAFPNFLSYSLQLFRSPCIFRPHSVLPFLAMSCSLSSLDFCMYRLYMYMACMYFCMYLAFSSITASHFYAQWLSVANLWLPVTNYIWRLYSHNTFPYLLHGQEHFEVSVPHCLPHIYRYYECSRIISWIYQWTNWNAQCLNFPASNSMCVTKIQFQVNWNTESQF